MSQPECRFQKLHQLTTYQIFTDKLRPLSATLQISLPRFISQERIFRGFPWPTKVTRRDREGVSRVICYINISAMLGFRVDDSDRVEYAENMVKTLASPLRSPSALSHLLIALYGRSGPTLPGRV